MDIFCCHTKRSTKLGKDLGVSLFAPTRQLGSRPVTAEDDGLSSGWGGVENTATSAEAKPEDKEALTRTETKPQEDGESSSESDDAEDMTPIDRVVSIFQTRASIALTPKSPKSRRAAEDGGEKSSGGAAFGGLDSVKES
eukprot:TRINITY_DN21502_c0_g1_i1.p2 TRINITY_DN21502_c0_g1~~TRINITY_DN21502_c0_g1_i1.p2  ORF type:complete len:140 (-),score=33.30 TRINITY_DN21502_c0_g1_i1:32-451(-)